MNKSNIKKTKSAFSLVEVLIVVFIMSVAFISFYTVSTVGTKYIVESKNRLAAVALANEKMEIVRNLAYDDVGLDGGVPSGNIPQDEDVTANGRTFHVRTLVLYNDDSLDDVYPTDDVPNDYKTVKVVVSWNDSNGTEQNISSISRFVPAGMESLVGGAPLEIIVKGNDGIGVSQSSVKIVNNSVSPAINFTVESDDSGHILIQSAPESFEGYKFTITKNGYETVETKDVTATFIPEYKHASVILGSSFNSYSYIQDKLADLTIKSEDYQGNPIGNIEFSIEGGRIIGQDETGKNVYSMPSTDDLTGSTSGEKKYEDISPGSYNLTMKSNSQYEFIDFNPSQSPATLSPDGDIVYTMYVADKNINGLFLKVKDTTGNNISGATITMTDNGGVEIFSNKESSGRGVVFYPDGSNVLNSETYNLEIEAAGYETENTTVTINKLTEKSVTLTASN